MKPSLTLRPIVLGIVLAAAGLVLVIASGRERERIITAAPGVYIASPSQPGAGWDLLLDESQAAGTAEPAGGVVHAENVTQYGVLADGRVLVEGVSDGMPSFLLVQPAAQAPADVEGEFPSRASLEAFLERESLRMPSMSSVTSGRGPRAPALLWGGIACIGAGLLIGLVAFIPRGRP